MAVCGLCSRDQAVLSFGHGLSPNLNEGLPRKVQTGGRTANTRTQWSSLRDHTFGGCQTAQGKSQFNDTKSMNGHNGQKIRWTCNKQNIASQ